ncbi:MAG: fluoride efflux transporter CrcB [Anaerolineae bacterium]
METFLIIGLGAVLGANLRYLVTVWTVEQFGVGFPLGTLVINVTGSFLLAAFLAWVANHTTVDPRVRLLVATGFFGAYTTFSTYANDSIAMIGMGNWLGAVGNIVGTNLVCLVSVVAGLAIGSQL